MVDFKIFKTLPENFENVSIMIDEPTDDEYPTPRKFCARDWVNGVQLVSDPEDDSENVIEFGLNGNVKPIAYVWSRITIFNDNDKCAEVTADDILEFKLQLNDLYANKVLSNA